LTSNREYSCAGWEEKGEVQAGTDLYFMLLFVGLFWIFW